MSVAGVFVIQSSHPRRVSFRASGKPDRLLRASVTSFCSTPRPSRREIAQLDDLAVPLLRSVSDETLRFVAAALAETPHAPPTLVRKLADQSVDVSAPLLMRSPVLTAIDLVALIGRHGIGHARAIAARDDLDGRILRLIQSLGALEGGHEPPPEPDRAEQAREKLRGFMRPAGIHPSHGPVPVQLRWEGEPGAYRKLRSTALAGVPALFHTALADALAVPLERAREIAEGTDATALVIALRHLCTSDEQAFLILRCARPSLAVTARETAAFLDAYNEIPQETAARLVEGWREAEDGAPLPLAANQVEPQRLRA